MSPVGLQAPPAQASLLRIMTCGSVDDGKSTLMGRLLYETGGAPEDTLAAARRDSRTRGDGELDVSLLLDGLEAEREQGITIDVAYRFFATPKRAFIVADTPGHEEYTRNMATGASTADLAILLVDARKGLLPQTRRHAAIASLLGVRQAVLAVNKMDLVGWDEAVFDRIVADFAVHARALGFDRVQPVPLAAKSGGNVVVREPLAPWYAGPTLLEHLETVQPAAARAAPFRFPVQWANRPDLDFRGASGTVASGRVAVGDPVVVAGSGRTTTIARIVTADGDLAEAHEGEAVTLTFSDDVDVARGDLLSHPRARPPVARDLAARLIWMSPRPLNAGDAFLLKIGGRTTPVRVTALRHHLRVDDLAPSPGETLELNGLAEVELSTSDPVAFDPYAENPKTGAFILIDRATRATVAAGLALEPLSAAREVHLHGLSVTRADREALAGHRGRCLWLTGLSGAGKSTLADALEQALHARATRTLVLDGDNLRHGLNADLGFSTTDRTENLRRTGEVARLFVEAGVVTICALVSPLRTERDKLRERFAEGDFLELFVDAPVELCRARDAKGLYAKADRGEITDFTGVSAPYEAPLAPDLRLDAARPVAELVAAVLARLDG